MFALVHISSTGVATSFGSPWPPQSGSNGSAFQPASANWRYASRNPLGVRTPPSGHFEPSWAPLRLRGSSTPEAKRAASSRIASTVSGVASSYPGSFATSASPASSFSTNLMSFSGAVYVLMLASLLQLFDHARHDLEQVADDAVVGHLEDRRFLVLVDRDDDAAVLH